MGSPPPMRGKAWNFHLTLWYQRITPAYAGKSSFFQCYSRIIKDHPRLCGEKWEYVLVYKLDRGSPPPMRGKGFAAGVLMPACGITPAYAGKSFLSTSRAFCNQDHPRLCGEKFQRMERNQRNLGSPPPMRGKVC